MVKIFLGFGFCFFVFCFLLFGVFFHYFSVLVFFNFYSVIVLHLLSQLISVWMT